MGSLSSALIHYPSVRHPSKTEFLFKLLHCHLIKVQYRWTVPVSVHYILSCTVALFGLLWSHSWLHCTVHCVHCVPCTEQHWGAGRWRTEKTQGGETPPRINRVGRQTNKQRVLYYCKKRWMFKEVAWCCLFPWPRDKQAQRKGATAVGDRAERRRRTIYLPMMRVYFFWKLWPRTKHDFF